MDYIIFSSVSAISMGLGDADACMTKGFLLGFGRTFPAADDGAGMAHAAARRSGGAGDEAGDGLGAVVLSPSGGFFLGRAADFADHDNAFSFRIIIEHLEHIQMGHARHGIAADTDAGGLDDARAGELLNRS